MDYVLQKTTVWKPWEVWLLIVLSSQGSFGRSLTPPRPPKRIYYDMQHYEPQKKYGERLQSSGRTAPYNFLRTLGKQRAQPGELKSPVNKSPSVSKVSLQINAEWRARPGNGPRGRR